MNNRQRRMPAALILALLATGCYRTTELCDLPDANCGTPDVPADVDAADDVDAVDADAPEDAPSDVSDTGDAPSPLAPAVWFATFRCPSLAGPIHPGAGIPAERCKLAVRSSKSPAVVRLEVFAGTGKVGTFDRPAETEEVEVVWGAFPGREIVLRARAVAADGTESEDVVPIRTLPMADATWEGCGTLGIRVDRPDNWEVLCEGGRLKAALAWTPDGFGASPVQWRVRATLGGVEVAVADQAQADLAFALPAGKTGIQSLVITGTAWLPAGGCCAGPDPCPFEVSRYLVADVRGDGCQPPACDVALDGPSDVVVAGNAWSGAVRVAPSEAGTVVRILLDGEARGASLDGLGGPVSLAGLEDGLHEVRAVARLASGGTCADRVRIQVDATPPEVDLPTPIRVEGTGAQPFVLSTRDASVVRLDPDPDGRWTCASPEPRASGVVEWACSLTMPPATQEVPVQVTARDAAGHVTVAKGLATTSDVRVGNVSLHLHQYHAYDPAGGPLHEQDPIPIVFGSVPVRLRLFGSGMTSRNLELLGFRADVDGVPADEAGLVLRPEDIQSDPGGYAVIHGTWDTTGLADGLHRVTVQVGSAWNPVRDFVEIESRSGALSGRQAALLQCDPAFTACAPFRSGHVAGNVGIRADLSWWAAAGDPGIRILAAGDEVARCAGRTCDWVLDWDALPRSAVEVTAEAWGGDFDAVRLATSVRVVRDLHDRDDDGFRAVGDGGGDCDDEDPFVNPAAADPAGPGCALVAAPVVIPLSEAPSDLRVLDAARDAEGTLHVLACDPGAQAFRCLRVAVGAGVELGEPVGVGSTDCLGAQGRFVQAADGTLRAAVAPGDGTAGFAVADGVFPPAFDEVQGFAGRLAAVLPDGVLAITGDALVAHRVADGAWTATTLQTAPYPQPDPSGMAATWIDPDGTVRIAAGMGLEALALATLPPAGAPAFDLLPADPSFAVSARPPIAAHGTYDADPWLEEGHGDLRLARDASGALVVLMPHGVLPIAAEPEAKLPTLWTGGPDRWRARSLAEGVVREDGFPGYRLRSTRRATLGWDADRVPFVAAVTSTPDAVRVPTIDWPRRLEVLVPRGDALVALPEAAALETGDAVAVLGAGEAAEVVAVDVRERALVLVGWPCAERAAEDTNCDGADGTGGTPCTAGCVADVDAANRVAGAMPLCDGGVSDGVRQPGESCDGGVGGIARGCRDCDFVDAPIGTDLPVASGRGQVAQALGMPDGTALIASGPQWSSRIQVARLDPVAMAAGVPTDLTVPDGHVFDGPPRLVARAADVVLVAGTQKTASNRPGPVQAIRLDAAMQVAGAVALDVEMVPQAAVALADGRVAIAGGTWEPDGWAGRLVVADPAQAAATAVWSWQPSTPRGESVAWTLATRNGDVVLLRTEQNWWVGEETTGSRVVVTALSTDPWGVRDAWVHETSRRVVSGALASLGAAGWVAAWTEDDMSGDPDAPRPRVVMAQRLDTDLAPVGAPVELDRFAIELADASTVAASPLPAARGPGAVVAWTRTDRVGPARLVTMRAVSVTSDGVLAGPVPVFDGPLFASAQPALSVAGPDALVALASYDLWIERARFLDPARMFAP
jgi:hypothetical protein